MRFATRIFHPNVQWGSGKGEGSVCIDVLHSGLWRPECTVRPSPRPMRSVRRAASVEYATPHSKFK